MSPIGPELTSLDVSYLVPIEGNADIARIPTLSRQEHLAVQDFAAQTAKPSTDN